MCLEELCTMPCLIKVLSCHLERVQISLLSLLFHSLAELVNCPKTSGPVVYSSPSSKKKTETICAFPF